MSNAGNSGANSPVAGTTLSVHVDHESIRMGQEQESVPIVVLDIDHHPSRTQGVLSETDRTKQTISYRNPGWVIPAHPNSRKVEIEALCRRIGIEVAHFGLDGFGEFDNHARVVGV